MTQPLRGRRRTTVVTTADAPPPRSQRLLGPAAVTLLLLGIGLRALLAWRLRGPDVGAWEADGFVRAWEGVPWGALDRVRPPLCAWLLHALAMLGSVRSVLGLRLLCVGVSTAGGLAALWAVGLLARRLRVPVRSARLAGAWMTGWWALSPTLVSVACRPTPDMLLGPVLCLLLAAIVLWGERRNAATALLLVVTATGALLAGGVLVACVLTLGLLIHVLPIPRLGVALPLVLMLAAAGGAAWLIQRGPDPARPWRPDTAPALAIARLLEAPAARPDLIDADARAARELRRAADALHERGGLQVARLYAQHLLLDELGSARFDDWGLEAARLSPVPVSLFDVFVRGGLLLFAAATVSMLRRSPEKTLPRAAVAIGLLLLVPLLVLGVSGPLALAPFDLPLLAIAAAGVAAADPLPAGLRWGAFSLGGALLLLLPLSGQLIDRKTPALAAAPPDAIHDDWWRSNSLVPLLADGGPDSSAGQVTAARLLMDAEEPLQRLPEAALAHALLASHPDPAAPGVLGALVTAYAENGQFAEAEALASSLRADSGAQMPDGRLLSAWLSQVQHDLRVDANH